MINEISNYTQQLWQTGRKLKRSPSGWVTGNAVCCHHHGENIDTRGRGGLITSSDGNVTWHCFNCQFTASYVTGRPLTIKFKKLLKWLGADDNAIQRLIIEALRVRDLISPESIQPDPEPIVFQPKSLPENSLSFLELASFYELKDWKGVPNKFHQAVDFVHSRHISMQKYDFYWSDTINQKMSHRIIIPFKYKGEVMGYTARTFVEGIIPKYYSDYPQNFVFNLDKQVHTNKFVIVCEGPFDAMSVDGVSVQHAEISETQAELIEALGKQVIVVPDFDYHLNKQNKPTWPGQTLIDAAINYGWSVSFPIWNETCKDINKAVASYGKLFTLQSILKGVESNKLKIELIKKKYAKSGKI